MKSIIIEKLIDYQIQNNNIKYENLYFQLTALS